MINRRFYGVILLVLVVFGLSAITPQTLFAQAEKGIALYNSKGYQEAEGVLRDALKADPTSVQARYYLGLSLLQQGKSGDALNEFKKVHGDLLRWDQWTRPTIPNEYQIQLALARANMALKLYDEAGRNLQLARIEDAGSSEVYLHYGVYYSDQKNYAEAIKALEKAISLDPKNAYAHYYIGMAYSESGQTGKMAAPFQTFLKLAPEAPEAAKVRSMINP
jgi:tetratricopeptide (TPR) repeat protein